MKTMDDIFKTYEEMVKLMSARIKEQEKLDSGFYELLHTYAVHTENMDLLNMLIVFLENQAAMTKRYKENMEILLMHL